MREGGEPPEEHYKEKKPRIMLLCWVRSRATAPIISILMNFERRMMKVFKWKSDEMKLKMKISKMKMKITNQER
eukprot:16341565-Heterocapsa_arctica.AAC.1